jgi:hypothetical protein
VPAPRRAATPQGFKLVEVMADSPDIPTFHTVGGKTYVVNHFE